MEWIERLNSVMNYIEEHLTDEIELNQVAGLANCSTYHFQRMFTYMTDSTLSEYIRKRKMSRAAVDLQDSKQKVIEVALKYGYDSPTAFNRAFKSIHGVAPSHVREEGIKLKAYPPISFKITVKGDSELDYRVETKEAFRMIGISKPLEKEIEKNFSIVPKMWEEAAASGTIAKLATCMNQEPFGLLGVSSCNEAECWKYYIAVSSNLELPDEFEEVIIPASTWAVFPGSGTNRSIQELEKRIVTEWLPTSGYEYANAPDIEVYLSQNPEDAKYEVWIPVVRNKD